MLHEKIQSTIALIEDVVDNRQKENDNANAAKRKYPPNNPPFPKTKDPRVRNSGIYFTVICRSSV